MPSTYEPIGTATATSGNTILTFSSIPATYTDLVLVLNAASTSTADALVRFNGDSGTNYSITEIWGNGSSASSVRAINTTSAFFGYNTAITTSFESVNIMHIQNYANTTTYKTALSRANTVSRYTSASVNVWRNTAAINSVSVAVAYAAGSTLTLYGIKAA